MVPTGRGVQTTTFDPQFATRPAPPPRLPTAGPQIQPPNTVTTGGGRTTGGRPLQPPTVGQPGVPNVPGRPPRPLPTRGGGTTAGLPTTGFTATDNLRGTQIDPVASAATRNAVGLSSGALEGLFDTPDRGDIAASTFERLRAQTEPTFQNDLRQVGQRAAALGRIGSGLTTTELGDVTSNRERFLTDVAGQLSDDAASRTLDDRLGRFGAATGAASLFENIDRGRRDELRGERGFQDELAQQATDDFVRQRTLEEMLLQGEFGRNQSFTQMLLNSGFADSPSNTLLAGADRLEPGGNDALAALGLLAGQR